MKTSCLPLALTLLAFIGCEQKASESAPVAAPLEAAFKDTSSSSTPRAASGNLQAETYAESLRGEVAQVQEQLRSRDYPDAVLSLQKIQRATNLTAGQIAAIDETMAKVQARLIEQAAQGDPRAKKAIEDFQKNLPK